MPNNIWSNSRIHFDIKTMGNLIICYYVISICWPVPFLRDLDEFRATNGRECFHEYSKKSAEITTTFQNKNDKKKLLIVQSTYIRCEIHKNSAKHRTAKKNRQTSESERIFFRLCIHVSLRCYSSQQIPVGCWKNASFFAISLAYFLHLNYSFFFLGFFLAVDSTEKIRRANKFYEKNSVQCAYFNVKHFYIAVIL